MERRSRLTGHGVLFALLARGTEREQDRLSRMGRQAGLAWHDPARVLALAGLDFAGRACHMVLGGMVAQSGIWLRSKMDSHRRVSLCAVLGDPVDVGGRFRPRYSRLALFVCRDPRHGAFGAARKNARSHSSFASRGADSERDTAF